jgi:hypothetical protein
MYRGIGTENEMLSNCPYNIGKHCFLLTLCHAFINVRLALPATGYGLFADVETVDADFLTFSELDTVSVPG